MHKFEEWTLAYRKIGSTSMLDDSDYSDFKIIKNNWRYWCADPFLFDWEGHTYVFAELYDRVKRKGVIGFCEIKDDGYTKWDVALEMPYHLSYPYIFEENGTVYMIPESYVGNEIALYKAIDFPKQWEKVKVLKENYVAVDSTVFSNENRKWILTFQFVNGQEHLNLYGFDDLEMSNNSHTIAIDDKNKRPGGKFFKEGHELYRPAQDCTKSYGCALNFYRINDVQNNSYDEELVRKVYPNEIKSNFKGIPQGIHTYNRNDNYEIIDLKSYRADPLFYIMRPFWYVYRKIKKGG